MLLHAYYNNRSRNNKLNRWLNRNISVQSYRTPEVEDISARMSVTWYRV
jgi:hypothetical protein